MCGIIGSHGSAAISIEKQLHLLTHRGPDHQDAIQMNAVTLGHTRLAIVDVEHGQQPLKTPDNRYWLISNGEIYNHRQIRAQFPDYPFSTDSDSEVILPLFEAYGTAAVTHLDGMFAFAIYDTLTDKIFLARDPIGIKPLYYGWQNNTLYFASEIKSLHQRVDDLQECPPGHYLYEGILTPYFNLNHLVDTPPPAKAPIADDVRRSLTAAVHKRLMSDVPLGVYLSGGLDSTIITALVAQKRPNVHSFSVGVAGSQDLDNARRAAEFIGTQHHEYIYDAEEVLAALPEIIYYLESFDPSLVRSAIPNYFLAQLTRQYVTVVLTGEGADELYAGYHYLKQFDDNTLNSELIALTENLYNCNLQRCDRMTMAHSIEARVPFLDIDFIKLSLQIPKAQKIHPETQIEKWILREAFADILPDHVTWRTKEQFSQGTGSNEMMASLSEGQFSDTDFMVRATEIRQRTGIDITSKEMLLYYDAFCAGLSERAVPLVRLWRGHDVISPQ